MSTTRGERLRQARENAGYKSARLAAKAMGIAVSTYGAHERAEDPGGRDFGPDEATRYAKRFKVTPEWLLTGRWLPPDGDTPRIVDHLEEKVTFKVPVVGYVGAGSKAHFYDVAQGDLDDIDPPAGSNEATVAVEIRGDSLGPFFNRWLVFYDKIQHPLTEDMLGELCVVGLEDGRILIKQVQRGSKPGLYNLASPNDAPIKDMPVQWAAKVNIIQRRLSRADATRGFGRTL
jgi:phage repressor protein C with HTH and peptisase S24 domain